MLSMSLRRTAASTASAAARRLCLVSFAAPCRWNSSYRGSSSSSSSSMLAGAAALFTTTAATLAYLFADSHRSSASLHADAAESTADNTTTTIPVAADGLPFYTRAQVALHKTPESRIWVTYLDGVYDVTEFVALHPGGKAKIMLAAGGSVEPFWRFYQQHHKAFVQDVLKEYLIGHLHPSEVIATTAAAANAGAASSSSSATSTTLDSAAILAMQQLTASDPYANEPVRDAGLRACNDFPYNAEPDASVLVNHYITPNHLFFVRNHLPVPLIDPSTYRLHIEGEGVRTHTFTLDDLQHKFRKYSVEATLECAGNRRSEASRVQHVKGLDWQAGAISNAVWSGARLKDVLEHTGLRAADVENGLVEHVIFEGLDVDGVGEPYTSSIPVLKALSPFGECLLAYEMNGEPLSRDHGFPVRSIIPGSVGARNVKWLGRIVPSRTECDSHWQNDYKGFAPNATRDSVDFASAPAIQEMPVQSAICEPAPGATVTVGERITVRGYAWSGGGRKVVRVDVSPDNGKSWDAARIVRGADQKSGRAWGWVHWEYDMVVPSVSSAEDFASTNLCCKAVDEAYNVQPDTVAPQWNFRGVLVNAWHRVPIAVRPSKSDA